MGGKCWLILITFHKQSNFSSNGFSIAPTYHDKRILRPNYTLIEKFSLSVNLSIHRRFSQRRMRDDFHKISLQRENRGMKRKGFQGVVRFHFHPSLEWRKAICFPPIQRISLANGRARKWINIFVGLVQKFISAMAMKILMIFLLVGCGIDGVEEHAPGSAHEITWLIFRLIVFDNETEKKVIIKRNVAFSVAVQVEQQEPLSLLSNQSTIEWDSSCFNPIL